MWPDEQLLHIILKMNVVDALQATRTWLLLPALLLARAAHGSASAGDGALLPQSGHAAA
jgi:hypothetical protein